MESKTFVIEKYGNKKEFVTGQKVECVYYHEYDNEKDAYQRSFLSKMIDKPFKPVKLGVILGDAGIHPYWLGSDRKEQYLFVKFKEYKLPKPIPISCIQDALESAERNKRMIEENKNKVGEKGYSYEAMYYLQNQMEKAFEFVGK